jgi:hypothetical protein
MTEDKDASTDIDFNALFPGVEVPIGDSIHQVTVEVFPLGYRHLEKFARDIAGLIVVASKIKPQAGQKEEDVNRAVLEGILPYVQQNLLALLAECCVVKKNGTATKHSIRKLPHWEIPKLIQLWLEQSFGSKEKWLPWVEAIENLMMKVTGKKPSIIEKLSQFSSPLVTD